jgi:hypothetical protein
MLKDCPKFDEVPNKYFLPASKNSHNFRYLISKLPHPIKKPSYLSIGNSAFGLRQSAFPQPFPKEWALLSLQFTESNYIHSSH